MRSITCAVVVAVVILVGIWTTSRPHAQGAALLPPIFADGQQVVAPAGQLITVAAEHGDWIQIRLSDAFTNTNFITDPETGRSVEVTGLWFHVPSGALWGETR